MLNEPGMCIHARACIYRHLHIIGYRPVPAMGARLIRNNGHTWQGSNVVALGGGAKGARDSESRTKNRGKAGTRAHNSSADAKQTKRRQEEMKEGTCELMSAQTQTPLPRLDPTTNKGHPPSASFPTPLAASSSHRRGLILRRMAQNKRSPAEVSGQTLVSRPTRQATLSTETLV